MPLSHVPPPADAAQVAPWSIYAANDWRRQFTVAQHQVDGMEGDQAIVSLIGEQVQTGDVLRRYGYVECDSALTASQLRQLAAACLNTADELDQGIPQ